MMQISWRRTSRFVWVFTKTRFINLLSLLVLIQPFPVNVLVKHQSDSSIVNQVIYNRFNNEIHVSLESSDIRWKKGSGGFSLSLQNSEILSVPGIPELPYFPVTIVLPPNSDFTISNQTSEYSLITPSKELFISPPENQIDSSTSESKGNVCSFSENDSFIQYGDPFWFREQKLMTIIFYPILWDCDQEVFTWKKELKLILKFDEITDSKNTGNQEKNLLNISPLVINSDDYIPWSSTPPVLWGGDLRDPWQNRIKIEIGEPGIYQLFYEDLQHIGFDVVNLKPDLIHIENQGREISYWFEGDSDQLFESGESILFYAEEFSGEYLSETYANQSSHWSTYNSWSPEFSAIMLEKYVTSNVYWFYVSEIPGNKIQEIDGSPGSDIVLTTFLDRVHFEEENVWWTTHFTSEDTWFWKDLAVYSYPFIQTFNIELIDPVIDPTQNAKIAGQIISVTSSSSQSPDHHVEIKLNNRTLTDDYWDGSVNHLFSGMINQEYLNSGGNELSIIVHSQGLPVSRYVFDDLDVQYLRNLKANNDFLRFTKNTSESADILISGLSSSNNIILDITNPLDPLKISNASFMENNLKFRSGNIGEHKYIVSNQNAIKPVTDKIALYKPVDLLSPDQQSDYIIISPDKFFDSLQPLVDYRSKQGYQVRLVDLQDVYNQFNAGIPHPIAIKNFFGYVYQHWASPAPAYVLLVGDGHWDLKKNKSSAEIYLPPNFVWVDPIQGEVDSLSDLVSVVGEDIFPDAMIGRMPVNNPDELDAFITKTISFETSTNDWKKNLTFIADNYFLQDPLTYPACIDNNPATICPTDPAGNFPGIVTNLINNWNQRNFSTTRIFLDEYNCRSSSLSNCFSVKEDIKASFSQGNQIITYNGHGAITNWASEKIFHVENIAELTNQNTYPIVFSLDCVDGYWYFPPNYPGQTVDRRSLSEELTRVSEKGAVAMLSSPGNGYLNGHDLLQQGFFNGLFDFQNPTLGMLDLSAKLSLMSSFGQDSLVFTYMIFGDPALKLTPIPFTSFLPMVSK